MSEDVAFAGGVAPRVSVVIVTYDSDIETVELCLAALQAQSFSVSQVIVSDNSPDGRFAEHFAARDLTIVKNARNEGFTGGTWAAASVASGDLLFFVNPDAQVDPDCLDQLAAALVADPSAVIAGAQILLPDGTVNTGELPVHFSGLSWCGNYRGSVEDGLAREAFAVSGCAYLVRASTFRRFQGFRSRFEMYYDDTDLCWRTHLAGLKTLYVPSAHVVHDYSDKAQYRWLWVERNRLLMLISNVEARTLLVLLPGLLATELGSWLAAVAGGWWRYKARAYWQIASRPKWLRLERRKVRAYRLISDAQLLRHLKFELETPGRPNPSYLRVVNLTMARYRVWVLARL